ncbi:hypothetical protein I2492_15485 [Budviciaceae bacterium CWB-B4]|uniref:Uncharacterized protein n=1 Tax=Limnobaculum xujianqingii TaxID=2738837 RepID=A0A9D7FVH9_9GAMM|nr:hypothetical protein [Limnobaculum xujianqingii]MBK5074611.1 hypothetical protein [Limnobaculum xujianqingii]MBK5177723.1 hypothetical protein [Limnobaculum xujianqingii]
MFFIEFALMILALLLLGPYIDKLIYFTHGPARKWKKRMELAHKTKIDEICGERESRFG